MKGTSDEFGKRKQKYAIFIMSLTKYLRRTKRHDALVVHQARVTINHSAEGVSLEK